LTSDCYAILGVSPAAEDVVIGAAYRALMRHYHPDTNPNPTAQARAREITAAYAVLRDPAKRAEYDARRADGDLWSANDEGDSLRKPPPAMRTVGIASAALALALVATVWTMAERNRPPQPTGQSQSEQKPAKSASGPDDPLIQLEPESERLARLREEAEILSPPTPINERLAALDTMAADSLTRSIAHAADAKKALLLAARNRSAAKRKTCASDACVADAYVRQIRETSAIMEGRTGPP
jgi:hypothetical protein